MRGFKFARILGFDISVDWSWIIIFLLVTWTLAEGYFPSIYKFSPVTNWVTAVIASLLLFVSVLIHELSHSVLSRRFGTPVKGITLFIFGGVSQTEDEPKSAYEEFWMAIAGPITSIVLAGIFFGFGRLGVAAGWPLPVVAVLGYLALINMILGVFNLIPGFPLDGGRVLRSILWGATKNLELATRYASYVGQGFGYLLIAFGFFNILFSANLIGGIWSIFIGWFLTNAAKSSYQQTVVRQALTGIRVDQVMTTDVPAIPADLSLKQFVNEQLLRHDYSCYPVTYGEDVIGVIGAEEIRKVPSDQWDFVRVGDIVHRINNSYKIDINDDAWDALMKLASEESVCRLMVMEDGHLKGTVGRDAMFRLVQTRVQRQGV